MSINFQTPPNNVDGTSVKPNAERIINTMADIVFWISCVVAIIKAFIGIWLLGQSESNLQILVFLSTLAKAAILFLTALLVRASIHVISNISLSLKLIAFNSQLIAKQSYVNANVQEPSNGNIQQANTTSADAMPQEQALGYNSQHGASTETLRCPDCGSPVTSGSRQCSYCGCPINS